ncbi:MAG: extracellular solute-binding protein [Succinivibrio sp.]
MAAKKLLVTGIFLVFSVVNAHAELNSSSLKKEIILWEDQHKSHALIPLIEKFEKENNCTVLIKEKKASVHYDELLRGEEVTPDIFILSTQRLTEAVSGNMIIALPFMKEDSSRYDPKSVKAVTFGNDIYACPRSIDSLVVYYNRDLLEYPFETLEEYKRYSASVKDSGTYGLIGDFSKFYFANGFILGNGGYVFGKTRNGGHNIFDIGLNGNNAINGIRELISFTKECVPKEVLSKKGESIIDLMFIKGHAAAVINGPWAMSKYAQAGLNYGIAPLPKLNNGHSISPFYEVKAYAIPQKGRHKELAQKLIKFLNEEENAKFRYLTNAELPPLNNILNESFIAYDDLANCILGEIRNSEPMPSVAKMQQVLKYMDIALDEILHENSNEVMVLNSAVNGIRLAD